MPYAFYSARCSCRPALSLPAAPRCGAFIIPAFARKVKRHGRHIQKERASFRLSAHSMSTKWQSHFVEFAFFTVSKADGREKWKEWFRLWPKPPRPTGIAGRYESSQRGMMPLRHLLIGFVDSLRPYYRLLAGRNMVILFFVCRSSHHGSNRHPTNPNA